MPINSPQSNDYTELLEKISQLTLTGGGGAGFRYARSAEINLTPNQETIILGSSSDCLREVYLINQSDVPVELFWFDGVNSIKIPKDLKGVNSVYQDWSDGGLELKAKSQAEANLTIWIRSNKAINYQIGTDEMIPVKIILYAQTTRDYMGEDSDPGNFSNNLNRLFSSNEYLTGHKILTIAQSTPGKELNFKIQSPLPLPIAFQWFDPFELALQGFKIASDVLNPESDDLPMEFMSRFTREGTWASFTNSLTEPIKLKPNRCEFMGRFLAFNSQIGAYDTAIITDYSENLDNPFDGGTVTLGGF